MRRKTGQRIIGKPVALVTGAGRGIGRATAEAFAHEGWAIAIAERDPVTGRRAARVLSAAGARAAFIPADVSDPRSAARAVAATLARLGRIDCLVNNAGVLTPGALQRLPLAALDAMLDVNLRGPLLMCRAALPPMLRRRRGAIVNVASQLAKSGIADYVTYSATKFGVLGLTEALADELAGTGVRVWAVCPGLVDTALARHAGITSARERASLIRPASVARAIVDLATGRRRATSGTAIDVLR